jgi:plastocyanin domain-containing protein
MRNAFFILMLVVSFSSLALAKEKKQEISISVTENGFEPAEVIVNANSPVILKVTRKTDSTCAKEISISSKHIKKDLPLNKMVSIDLGILKNGKIRFACGMDMLSGEIVIR